jgi:hypothetical protein
MRTMTRSEQRLLTVFLVLLIVVANLLGWSFALGKRKTLSSKLVELRAEEKAAAQWVAERKMWEERRAWLDQHQPKMTSDSEANAELLNFLQSSARKQNITIVEQALRETSGTPQYREVSAGLKVTGSLDSIVRWLVELQQPDKFYVIKNFSLKSTAEPPKMTCDLEVARRHAPPS